MAVGQTQIYTLVCESVVIQHQLQLMLVAWCDSFRGKLNSNPARGGVIKNYVECTHRARCIEWLIKPVGKIYTWYDSMFKIFIVYVWHVVTSFSCCLLLLKHRRLVLLSVLCLWLLYINSDIPFFFKLWCLQSSPVLLDAGDRVFGSPSHVICTFSHLWAFRHVFTSRTAIHWFTRYPWDFQHSSVWRHVKDITRITFRWLEIPPLNLNK